MGQNHPLRFLPANCRHVLATHNHAARHLLAVSLAPADGPLRSESFPGYSPQSIPVLVRYVAHARETRRTAKTVPLVTPPEELPVRLAHRVRELDDLPQGLSDMPSIRRVKEWYAQSFEASMVTGHRR